MVLPAAVALLALSGASASPLPDIFRRQDNSSGGSLGWKLQTTYQGDNFFSTWNWETFDDPTNGRTNYVNLDEAKQKGLTWVDDQGRFGMKVDDTSHIDRNNTSVRGRDSVRIQSQQRFGDSLIVLDIDHMPVGCGTWPAFWTIGTGDWPTGGEIDIIEGTNDQGDNQFTVHTTTGCKIPAKGQDLTGNNEPYSGNAGALDCSPGAGCSIHGTDGTTFGPGMNAAGGGFVVTRIDKNKGVSFWWFPRNKGIPQVLTDGKDSINEQDLGERIAHFPASSECDLNKSLTEQQLIFNTAMCGGWCASRYPAAQQCQAKYPGEQWEDIIDNHPEEFKDAYWLINSVKVFQPCAECGPGGGSTSSAAPPPSSSVQAPPSSSSEAAPTTSSSISTESPSTSSSTSTEAAPSTSSTAEQTPSQTPSQTPETSTAQPTPTPQTTFTTSQAPQPQTRENGWSAWSSYSEWSSYWVFTTSYAVPPQATQSEWSSLTSTTTYAKRPQYTWPGHFGGHGGHGGHGGQHGHGGQAQDGQQGQSGEDCDDQQQGNGNGNGGIFSGFINGVNKFMNDMGNRVQEGINSFTKQFQTPADGQQQTQQVQQGQQQQGPDGIFGGFSRFFNGVLGGQGGQP